MNCTDFADSGEYSVPIPRTDLHDAAPSYLAESLQLAADVYGWLTIDATTLVVPATRRGQQSPTVRSQWSSTCLVPPPPDVRAVSSLISFRRNCQTDIVSGYISRITLILLMLSVCLYAVCIMNIIATVFAVCQYNQRLYIAFNTVYRRTSRVSE